MNHWVIGSFYTSDSPYESVYNQYLLPSLKRLQVEYPHLRWICKETKNQRNWNKNVAQKPLIIKEILQELNKDEYLVFVDADATFEQYPILFDELDCDIAFHMLSWRQWYGYNSDVTELLTGTMFFRNNEKILALCQEWYNEVTKTFEWEQKSLERIIKDHILTIYELPVEYCFIKSRPSGPEPLVKTKPVILHHQVSRTLKRKL